ncbi:hypothetical protein BKA62DRAFT_160440 [Auriculariales sp. MPI-PUGE-AT-0066]|nr:hypothetical protein BKA62DRAFT_160440 [Auriculariales sp. MPI-PUGE-AT-0066]
MAHRAEANDMPMWDAYKQPSSSHVLPRPSPQPLGTSGTTTSGGSSSSGKPSQLRLVVTQSLILPRKQRIAVFDLHAEISIGRDISLDPNAPRLRLKEMAVSKFHASVFFSFTARKWSIVDLGSVHGTTINGVRLSPARQSSPPLELKHGDDITIGSTTLNVHAHRDALPCTECVSSGDNEISLFDPRSRELGVPGKPVAPQPHQSARAAISTLRNQLVPRDAPVASASSASFSDDSIGRVEYKDRAAMRRARHSNHTEPVQRREPPRAVPTPVQAPMERSLALSGNAVSFTFRRSSPSPNEHGEGSLDQPLASAPSKPLETSNIGHQLLVKQGWTPGASLGLTEGGRVEPVMVERLPHRAGLGSASVSSASGASGASGLSSGDERGFAIRSRRKDKHKFHGDYSQRPHHSRRIDRGEHSGHRYERERDRDERVADNDWDHARSRVASDESHVHGNLEMAQAMDRTSIHDSGAGSGLSSTTSLSIKSAPARSPGEMPSAVNISLAMTAASLRSSNASGSISPGSDAFVAAGSQSPPQSMFDVSSGSSRQSSAQPPDSVLSSRAVSLRPQNEPQGSTSSLSTNSSSHRSAKESSDVSLAENPHTSSTSSLSSQNHPSGTPSSDLQSQSSSSLEQSQAPRPGFFVYESSRMKARSRRSAATITSSTRDASLAPRPGPHSLDNIIPKAPPQPHVNIFNRHTMMSISLPTAPIRKNMYSVASSDNASMRSISTRRLSSGTGTDQEQSDQRSL